MTKISQDERYPYYSVSEKWGEDVGEVPKETLDRWASTAKAFERMQDEMEAVFKEAEQRNRLEAAIEKAEKAAREAQERLDALRSQAD